MRIGLVRIRKRERARDIIHDIPHDFRCIVRIGNREAAFSGNESSLIGIGNCDRKFQRGIAHGQPVQIGSGREFILNPVPLILVSLSIGDFKGADRHAVLVDFKFLRGAVTQSNGKIIALRIIKAVEGYRVRIQNILIREDNGSFIVASRNVRSLTLLRGIIFILDGERLIRLGIELHIRSRHVPIRHRHTKRNV